MSRSIYLVSYDIMDEKRLTKVHKKMLAYGSPLQYSVFICDLSRKEKEMMISDLIELIKHDEDRIMIVNLGPVEGNAEERIEYLGVKPTLPQRESKIF